jgi:hypothetical protein
MYKADNKNPAACTSSGGVLSETVNSGAQMDDCKAILQQAGPQGTGIITYSSLPHPKKVSRGGLSASENIGLAIGVILVVIISTASFLWLLRQRSKKATLVKDNRDDGTDNFGKVELPTNSSSSEKNVEGKAELPYSPVSSDDKWKSGVEEIERIEKDGEEKFELDVGMGFIEMPTDYNNRAELADTPMKSEKY